MVRCRVCLKLSYGFQEAVWPTFIRPLVFYRAALLACSFVHCNVTTVSVAYRRWGNPQPREHPARSLCLQRGPGEPVAFETSSTQIMFLRSRSEPLIASMQSKSPLKARRGRLPGSITRSRKVNHSPEAAPLSKARLIAPDTSYTRFTAPISSETTSSTNSVLATPSHYETASSSNDTRLAAYGCISDQAGLHRLLTAIHTQDQATQCYIPSPPPTPHICADDGPQVIIFEARWDKIRLVPETRFRGTFPSFPSHHRPRKRRVCITDTD